MVVDLVIRINRALGSMVGNRPLVLVGIIESKELINYNIYSKEDYYLFTQVSHNIGTHLNHMRT